MQTATEEDTCQPGAGLPLLLPAAVDSLPVAVAASHFLASPLLHSLLFSPSSPPPLSTAIACAATAASAAIAAAAAAPTAAAARRAIATSLVPPLLAPPLLLLPCIAQRNQLPLLFLLCQPLLLPLILQPLRALWPKLAPPQLYIFICQLSTLRASWKVWAGQVHTGPHPTAAPGALVCNHGIDSFITQLLLLLLLPLPSISCCCSTGGSRLLTRNRSIRTLLACW